MKVYAVKEAWWNGHSGYDTSDDDVTIFTTRELAEKYAENFAIQVERADCEISIFELEVYDNLDKL